jgi:hypothetical protein
VTSDPPLCGFARQGAPAYRERARRALTHSLLAVSRWQTLDPQTTDVNPFVAGMAAPVKPFAMASLAAKISDILQT